MKPAWNTKCEACAEWFSQTRRGRRATFCPLLRCQRSRVWRAQNHGAAPPAWLIAKWSDAYGERRQLFAAISQELERPEARAQGVQP